METERDLSDKLENRFHLCAGSLEEERFWGKLVNFLRNARAGRNPQFAGPAPGAGKQLLQK